MKKVLGILGLAVALTVTSSADASVLRMDFGGGATEITVALSNNFTIDFWVDRPNGGDVNSIVGLGTEIAGGLGLTGVGTSTSVPGWSAAGNIGVLEENLGAGSQNVSLFADQLVDGVAGGGSTLLGTLTAHATVIGSYDLTFSFPNTAFGITMSDGTTLDYHAGYGPGYDSYFLFGTGSPAVAAAKTNPGQAASPITVHVVPEPAALALLGLGAIVALRRKVA